MLQRRTHLIAVGQQTPHPQERRRHLALISRVVGVRGGQPLANVQRPGVVLQRRTHLIAVGQQTPHPQERRRHLALISRVVGVCGGQPFDGVQGSCSQAAGSGEVEAITNRLDKPQAGGGEVVTPLVEPAGDGGGGDAEQADVGPSRLLQVVRHPLKVGVEALAGVGVGEALLDVIAQDAV